MNELTLFLFAHELDSMDEYSSTLPSATTVGKMWKCRSSATPSGWVVGLYAYHIPPTPEELRRDHHHAGRTRILWFDVVLRHGPEPRIYRAPDWSNYAGWKAERAAERAAEARSEVDVTALDDAWEGVMVTYTECDFPGVAVGAARRGARRRRSRSW